MITVSRNNSLYKNRNSLLADEQLIFTSKLENYINHFSMTFINNAHW